MKIPVDLTSSLQQIKGFNEEAFLRVHQEQNSPVSIRLNPSKKAKETGLLEYEHPVPWCENGFYLKQRPVFTLDPLLHAGTYYVQEASSMFLEQAIKTISTHITISKVLDISAAPGGKSTHLSALLPDTALLVSNEIIHSRASILVENITKWGAKNSIVTQNSPGDYSRLGPVFDVIVVDAPCSGSGLFRRDPDAMDHWSLEAVEHCSLRQKEIIQQILPCLKPGGFLVYSTCSFYPKEDEDILDWIAGTFQMKSTAISWADGQSGVVQTQSEQSASTGYRFFPDRVVGEGFFLGLFQKAGEWMESYPEKVIRKKIKIIPDWLPQMVISYPEDSFFQHEADWFYFPQQVASFFAAYKSMLHIRKAGVRVAAQIRDQFSPDHALALSGIRRPDFFQELEVDLTQALRFLKKEDFELPATLKRGWVLIQYQGLGLGWLKNIGNRANNYYPKEWKIKMKIEG